jgi:hypothetical protein
MKDGKATKEAAFSTSKENLQHWYHMVRIQNTVTHFSHI